MSKQNGAELINNVSEEIPLLCDWEATDNDIYMEFKNDYVEARYDKYMGLHENNKLGIFVLKKNHYKDKMDDICKVINYFTVYFDKDLELFQSMLEVKFIIDQRPKFSKKAFRKEVLKNIITSSFIRKINAMTDYLYTINIDSDVEGRYKSTPKITNAQAKSIVAISFAIRCILPLCIHFSDTNNNFIGKKDYIECFDAIITKLIKKFEHEDGIEIFHPLYKFVDYRVERSWKADIGICIKKKQLYGTTKELYLEEVVHEVILVKSLYKLDYNRSVVSFIDGVIFLYHYNFKIENFKSKPIEIDSQESTGDDNERLTHAEAIEMSVYRIDESNAIISEVNNEKVVKKIRKKFNIPISEEELDFYRNNVRISRVSKLFLESFYAKFFHDPNAALNINDEITLELLIYMKKYLQLRGMEIIPQLCTAKVRGKYKENTIKNAKFIEKVKTSDGWKNVIENKFTYVSELSEKDDELLKRFSSFVSSTFEFVDFNGPDDGYVYEDIDQDKIIAEFTTFLTII